MEKLSCGPKMFVGTTCIAARGRAGAAGAVRTVPKRHRSRPKEGRTAERLPIAAAGQPCTHDINDEQQ